MGHNGVEGNPPVIEALLQSIDARLAHIQRHIDPKHRLPDKPSSPTNAFPRIIPRREDDQ